MHVYIHTLHMHYAIYMVKAAKYGRARAPEAPCISLRF